MTMSSNFPKESSITLPAEFTLFPQLPPEIRHQIWVAFLTPRIIKWTHDVHNAFTPSAEPVPLSNVCHESRETAFEYGKYRDLRTLSDGSEDHGSQPVYFSPTLDYLFFDPKWADLLDSPPPSTPLTEAQRLTNLRRLQDPLDNILPVLNEIRNIMIHPIYTDERKKPTAQLARLPHLKQILVAADEKSIGLQTKFMLSTVYDTKTYYHFYNHIGRGPEPKIKIPRIAVGCLGWTGAERRKMHHGGRDQRKLVTVFMNEEEMKVHLRLLREEEWQFTQEQRSSGGLKLKFKLKEGLENIEPKVEKSAPMYVSSAPPEYSELPGIEEKTRNVGLDGNVVQQDERRA